MKHWNITHGCTCNYEISKVYRAWRGIMNRCLNVNRGDYNRYGGRGIKVCDRWRKFENFLSDMGQPPSPEHSIDRIDVNGNYEKSNCRWIPCKEQARNKRTNRYIEGFGESKLMEDWAKQLGMSAAIIYGRVVRRGMSLEDAVKLPIIRRHRRTRAEMASA